MAASQELRDGVQIVRGEGIPLLLIHGNGLDHRSLLILDSALEATGVFERIYVDLPGSGATAALNNAGGIPELADWLEQLIRQQLGTRRFAVLGNSLGGVLGQEMAERFPDQILGMALIAPVVYPNAEQRNVPLRQLLEENPGLLASLDADDARLYGEMSVVQSRENWSDFERYILPGIRAANLRALAKLSSRYFLDPLPISRQTKHAMPVVILCGLQDHVTGFLDPQKLCDRYPGAIYRNFDRAGHNLHLDQRAAVETEIAQWAGDVQKFAPDAPLAVATSSD